MANFGHCRHKHTHQTKSGVRHPGQQRRYMIESSACTWWSLYSVNGLEGRARLLFSARLAETKELSWESHFHVSLYGCGLPKEFSELHENSVRWLPQWKHASSSMCLFAQVQGGIEWHSTSLLLLKGGLWFCCFDCPRWLLSAGEGVPENSIGTLRFPEQQTLSGATVSEYPVLFHCTATVKLTAIWNSEPTPKCLVWPCQSAGCWQD